MAPGSDKASSQKEGAGADIPSWHFRAGVRMGVGVGVLECKEGEREQDCSEMQHNLLRNYVWPATLWEREQT